MNAIEILKQSIPEIEEKIGYTFQKKELLSLAFVHRSFINENRELVQHHNERLEFLGDSVLGLLVSQFLYSEYKDIPEGDLSQMRARLVEAQSCMHYVMKLEIEQYILMGRGEKLSEGRGRESILSDLLEALMGAIFLDGGLDAARTFFFTIFSEDIKSILERPLENWKAQLQDYVQKRFKTRPIYTLESETGPDHSKVFEVSVSFNNSVKGTGRGGSKKEAQQDAAKHALDTIKNEK